MDSRFRGNDAGWAAAVSAILPMQEQRAPRFFQIMVSLQSEPEPLGRSERSGQSDSGIRRHAALGEHDFVDPTRRHARRTRERVLADAQRLQELGEEHFAGMNVGQLLHVIVVQ